MKNIENSFLKHMPIAHRGLHDAMHPENSLAAAQNAINHNYAIELDIRYTKDNRLIVYHDELLDRLTDHKGKVIDYTYEQLKEVRLLGGDNNQRIPLFSDFLNFVNGRVPLLIEFKCCWGTHDLVGHALDDLSKYRGEYAVQSFSPFHLIQLRNRAPEVIRGQLVTKDLSEMPKDRLYDKLNYIIVWAWGFTKFNFLSKPDFFNMDIRCFHKYQRHYRERNVISFCARTPEEYARAINCSDNVVFENMLVKNAQEGSNDWGSQNQTSKYAVKEFEKLSIIAEGKI